MQSSRIAVIVDAATGLMVDAAGNVREGGRYRRFAGRMLSMDRDPVLDYGTNGGSRLEISDGGADGDLVRIRAKEVAATGSASVKGSLSVQGGIDVDGGLVVDGVSVSDLMNGSISELLSRIEGGDGVSVEAVHDAGHPEDPAKDVLVVSLSEETLADISGLHGKIGPHVEVSWAELKALRDGGSLVPGQSYRITDYAASTNGRMDSQSAGHPFDIVVTAAAPDSLDEEARALRHAGDSYFPEETVFGAWRVRYCLDNDGSRFAWASQNGKGVVYRLEDEFGNDCPYDFKGLRFLAYGDSDNVYRYTFDNGASSDSDADLSLSGFSNHVYGNRILPFASSKLELNRIVFKGADCHSNTFGAGCHSNTFGSYCSSNTFGAGCSSNTFGSYCCSNTFGADCHSNTLGDGCSSNTFGSYCSSNTFGEECYSNTFGSYCSSNTFGLKPDVYDEEASYSEGDTCWFAGAVYRCTEATSGDFDRDAWVEDRAAAAKSYYQYIAFEEGVEGVFLDCTATRGDYEYYQNVEVSMGVRWTEDPETYEMSPKVIQDPHVDQDFKTTYKPADSVDVEV